MFDILRAPATRSRTLALRMSMVLLGLFATVLPGLSSAGVDPAIGWTITVTQAPHGTISPPGAIVPDDGSQTFTIGHDTGYHNVDVIVDGVSTGRADSYPFTHVHSNHTLTAAFAIDTLFISASSTGNGTITPSGSVPVEYGSDQSFAMNPAPNYHVVDVKVDNVSQGPIDSYTFTNVTENHTIVAGFGIDTYTIDASAGPGGSIFPSGTILVAHGDDQSFDITPDSGFHIADVVVDGSSVPGPPSSYTFTNISANHTIAATFASTTYTLTVNIVGSGTVTKTPNQTSYDPGSNVDLNPNPASGWSFSGWSGDATGNAVPLHVTMDRDKTITATFTKNPVSGSTLSIYDVQVTEGDSGTKLATFTVAVSPPVNHSITVNYATQGVTATSPEDYQGVSGTLTIPSSASSAPINVTIKGDTKVEPDETFRVLLSHAQGATLSDSVAVGTIKNDDASPSAITLSINDVKTTEGNSGSHYVTFTVTLSHTSSSTVKVDFTTKGVTATVSDHDYAGTSGTLSIPPGSLTGTISVLIYGDTKSEPDETFQLNLSNPVNATLSDAQGIGTICNDDGTSTSKPALYINDVSKNEGNSGTTAFIFTVSLSRTTNATVTVHFATSGITATVRGNDYIGRSGTLTIPANTSSGSITVQVKGDTKVEGDERFAVNLSSPTNATLGDAQGIGTIRNDDGSHVVAAAPPGDEPLFTGSDDQEGESVAEVIGRLSLSIGQNPVRGQLAVEFALPTEDDVRITVLDVQGRRVVELANGRYAEGRHQVRFVGSQPDLRSGVYFVRLETARQTIVQRFTALR